MKPYRVNITDRALADMESIYDYIATVLKQPDTAMKQYNRIADAILGLNVFPMRNAVLESGPEKAIGLRQQLIDSYSAFYTVGEDTVTVLRVLYSSSDIKSRLREG